MAESQEKNSMPANFYKVRPGDCIFKIAAENGIPWKKVWDHPNNLLLKNLRKFPNVLAPGDQVYIPALEKGSQPCDTGARHNFVLEGRRVEIRVRVHDHVGPRKQQPYHIEIDGRRFAGETSETDDDGMAICQIAAKATAAILVVGNEQDEYELLIGYMDPVNTVSGVQARLTNMGFPAGRIGATWDELSINALKNFLAAVGKTEKQNEAGDPTNEKFHDVIRSAYTI